MDQDLLHQRIRKTAHDVRTPITTIAGFADLLAEDEALPAGSRELAATIVTETRRLSDMLDAFWDELSANRESL